MLPGERVALHASGTSGRASVEVTRVGAGREPVWRRDAAALAEHAVPADVVERGCRWPAVCEIPVGREWRSGYYEVALRAAAPGGPLEALAFFVVRAAPGRHAPILLALATCTWNAYNDFGGANLYVVGGGGIHAGAPAVHFERPLAAGFLVKPEGGAAARAASAGAPEPDMGSHLAYLLAHRLSLWSPYAGWANWESRFAAWAEGAGFALDYATSADLESPETLEGHRLLLSVGHDEYWSWPMRDAVEGFVARGGNVAFFSGNTCYWQVRLEAGGRMVGYKQAFERDPLYASERHLVTTLWSDPLVGRPENHLTGVSFTRGGYARLFRKAPRGLGGYLVQRPEHWVFAGTGLAYGDVLGAEHAVVGYECDGCELALADGRPVPTGADGTPAGFEVLATSPASAFDRETTPLPIAEGRMSELEFHAARLLGSASPAHQARLAHGHAVLGLYTRGGTVLTTGCTDWAYGLAGGDRDVERVTRNVLARLAFEAAAPRP